MSRLNDQIEVDVVNGMDPDLLDAMLARVGTQDGARGSWVGLRGAEFPGRPWPSPDDPILSHLLKKAQGCLAAGMDPVLVLMQLAVHAWYEGGIEGYDAGQGDAHDVLRGSAG